MEIVELVCGHAVASRRFNRHSSPEITRGLNSMEMEIIAHRGASADAPENTLAAVRLGWEQGADAVEIDVQFSRDGHLIVIHDDNTRKGIFSASGLGDDSCSFRDAVNLNNLDDWNEYHAAVLKS